MRAELSIVSSIIDQRDGRAGVVQLSIAELTIVVPTLNERDNILPFLEKLEAALPGVAWEVIFVDDDSRDGTADAVRSIARRDPRVRCLQRIGRRGLSTACIEGVLASSSFYIAVMDADLQHDEQLLPQMLKALKNRACDLAVGSRYVPGGGVGEWDSSRANISGFATRLSRVICRVSIADPMSGFFMARRDVFEGAMRRLSGQGFKILLDLIASSPQPLRIKELPFQFRQREHGVSKLDTLVAWEFGMLLADKLIGNVMPVSFAIFAFITALGISVHLGTLGAGLYVGAASFVESQTTATLASMTATFFLIQLLTHRDRRLVGTGLIRGMILFYLILAAVGFVGVSIASRIFMAWTDPWLAGIAGAVISTPTSYVVARIITRRKR